MSFNWQLVAVVACVAWAAAVVVRRAMRLFSESPSNGCGSGGCSTCPSNTPGAEAASNEGFVSLQSLVLSGQSVHEAVGKAAAKTTGMHPIPDDRPLTPEERSLIKWMLEHGIPTARDFVSQLAEARVVTRCCCGCASLDFAIGGKVPPAGTGMVTLADYTYQSAGELFGVFVFEQAGLLAGLEVYSLEGQTTPIRLPCVEQLQPLSSVQGV